MARVNRALDLLAQGQPIYYEHVEAPGRGGYDAGRAAAGTWADYLGYDAEHAPFAPGELREFVRGLVDAGPTRSGHRTPAVIVSLPVDGSSEAVVRANAWMIRQTLAAGVHGLLLCHAETPEAVRAFVEAARYPHQTAGVGARLGVGRRGSGGQANAAAMWGLTVAEYMARAELLVGPVAPGVAESSAARRDGRDQSEGPEAIFGRPRGPSGRARRDRKPVR